MILYGSIVSQEARYREREREREEFVVSCRKQTRAPAFDPRQKKIGSHLVKF